MFFFPPRLPVVAALLWIVAVVPSFAQQPATAPILPDPRLTPGDTLDVTLADIQVRGYSAKVRDVPVAVKRQVPTRPKQGNLLKQGELF